MHGPEFIRGNRKKSTGNSDALQRNSAGIQQRNGSKQKQQRRRTATPTTCRPATASRRRLAYLLAEALARGAVRLALAAGEVLGLAHVGAVAAAHAQAFEPVALRQAVPRLRHRRRPQLCTVPHTQSICITPRASRYCIVKDIDSHEELSQAPVATRRSTRTRTGAAMRRDSAIPLTRS